MKQRKELFSLQLPLSLDCGENGPLEHAQALFAAIQPDDTLYILESPANDPEGIVSEAFVRALEVAGPTVSQWADFEFRLTAQTEDGAAISLLQPDPRPYNQVIFRPSAQLSELLLDSAYFGRHSDAQKNNVRLAKLEKAALEEMMHAVHERRMASAQNAKELIEAQNEAERNRSAQIDSTEDVLRLFRNY